jgi:hypothetical protein
MRESRPTIILFFVLAGCALIVVGHRVSLLSHDFYARRLNRRPSTQPPTADSKPGTKVTHAGDPQAACGDACGDKGDFPNPVIIISIIKTTK